jgi:hypothetical protein
MFRPATSAIDELQRKMDQAHIDGIKRLEQLGDPELPSATEEPVRLVVTRDTDLRIACAPPEYPIEQAVREDMEKLGLIGSGPRSKHS